MASFKTIEHNVDLCVIGGGLAGICTAVAAARNGIKVAIMQDRPMFGGNASSEIRMWICGASHSNPDNRETGIVEEIELENCYRNPYKNYSIWDSVLYQIVKFEDNIEVILNCSCLDAEMDGNKIRSATGWQLTTQCYHKINAKIFADCSGDSVLAPLTGAEFRWGREARSEFDEDIAPEVEDKKTMGLSCMIRGREYDSPRKYIPPFWIEKFTKEKLPYRESHMDQIHENFWYLELGGIKNTIEDTEEIRDELLKVAFGIWDYVRNSGECGDNSNWELDWVGMLPGKRESRRYMGDYILNQNDVRAEGKFDDLVAYGGWSMDDHHPEGLRYSGKPTTFHYAPNPYGIPYRTLYSKNIENLMFAGRNISATHSALSSTRVMATCGTLGQAVGTAAAIAVKNDTTPRGVYEKFINELKLKLMNDDCYLPFNVKEINELTLKAKVTSDGENAENLFNGIERNLGETENGWYGKCGSFVEFEYDSAVNIENIRIIFDSKFGREKEDRYYKNMGANIRLEKFEVTPPDTLIKKFIVEVMDEDGNWETVIAEQNNYQRFVRLPVNKQTKKVKFTPIETWGAEKAHVFAIELF